MKPVDLSEKLRGFDGWWQPKIVADYNGNEVFVVKMKGEFVWHSHADTDDFFLVLKGEIRVDFRDGPVTLREGELLVIPAGVEHRPVAEEEAHLLLIEPKGTPNTGDPATAAVKERI